MKYEEVKKIIVQEIAEGIKFQVGNNPIVLKPNSEPLINIELDKIESILLKFADEGKLTIKQHITKNIRNNAFSFGEKFINQYRLIEVDSEYFEELANQPDNETKINNETNPNKKDKFFIVYNKDRKVLLNGKIELAQTNFNSENDKTFSFLYENPNITFTKEEIKERCNIKIGKELSKTLENLGFRKGLKDTFFDVSKTSIKFHNPGKI